MTSAPVSSRSGRSNATSEDPASQQAKQFDHAIALFQSGQFKAARAIFEQVAEGPTRDLTFSAKMHVRMCDKRMEQAMPSLETADDHYNYGVALTNQRRLPEALQQLRQALAMKEASYFHYALGYCLALSGDAPAAIQHTKRAIEMDAANRTALRNDSEFVAALGSANVQAILR
ncbi:MAG: tetratricopeptide repeat protein [Acidobacteria bacterium]|nr:tetratricopeptide repeat protein [Acidobacteriota bacterium]